jgi:hypothetical protein
MNRKWIWTIQLGLFLVLTVGCRSTQPDLKPAKQSEVFNPPSENANLASYPKQAFNNANDQNNPGGMYAGNGPSKGPSMQPASFGGPSSGNMGGLR